MKNFVDIVGYWDRTLLIYDINLVIQALCQFLMKPINILMQLYLVQNVGK